MDSWNTPVLVLSCSVIAIITSSLYLLWNRHRKSLQGTRGTPSVEPRIWTWRVRGIPNGTSKEDLSRQLCRHASSFEHPNHATAASCGNIYKIVLTPYGDQQEQCATITTTLRLDGCRVDGLQIDDHFHGITPLIVPDGAQVDIFAITGLGGHAFGSFKSRKNWKNWLRDYLPDVIPSARILVYGYDSTVANSTSKASIKDMAGALLEHLAAFRVQTSTNRRPMIIIAHSIGGLLIKEMLARSRSDPLNCEWKDLSLSTTGLMFFGVPNSGMRHEELLTCVKGRANESLIRDLMQSETGEPSAYLDELAQKFEMMAGAIQPSYQMVLLYESRESPTASDNRRLRLDGPAKLVVNKQSACYTGANSSHLGHVSLDTNHSDLVKYENNYDDSFLIVLRRLKVLTESADNIVHHRFDLVKGLDQDQAECWRDLNRPAYDAAKKDVPEAQQKTLAWVLQDTLRADPNDQREKNSLTGHDFISWCEAVDNRCLLIQGAPGQGKSVLSKYIVNVLSRRKEDFSSNRKSLVIYCFCNDRESPHRRSASTVLRLLIVQLCQHEQSFKQLPNSWKRDSREFFSESFASLWSCFAQILQKVEYDQIYCIIDGLDVYDTDMVELCTKLRNLIDESPSNVILKLLCTTRPREDFVQSFRVGTRALKIPLGKNPPSSLKLTGLSWTRILRPYRKDIDTVVRARCDRLPNKYDDDMKSQVSATLLGKAGNTFLWIHLVLKHVETIAIPTRNTLDELLNGSPPDLNALFRMLIESANHIDSRYGHLLVAIATAQRPFNLAAVADFLVFSLKQTFHEYKDCHRDKPNVTEDLLRGHLGTLLDIVDGKVHLVHQSLRDYLNNLVLQGATNPARLDVAHIYMRYLLVGDIKYVPYESNTWKPVNGVKHYKNYPLATIAAHTWPMLYRNATEASGSKPLLAEILSVDTGHKQLFWLTKELSRHSSLHSAYPDWRPSQAMDVAIALNLTWMVEFLLEPVNICAYGRPNSRCLEHLNHNCVDVLRTLLFSQEAAHLEITPRVLVRVANSLPAMQLILDQRGAEVKITIEVIDAIAVQPTRSSNITDVLSLLLRRKDIQLPDYFPLSNRIQWCHDESILALWLDRYGQHRTIDQELIVACCRNRSHGDQMMALMLRHTAVNLNITLAVFLAAAQNSACGDKLVSLLLEATHGGEDAIIPEILLAAARNSDKGCDIFKIIMSKRMNNLKLSSQVILTAFEHWNCGETYLLELLKRPNPCVQLSADILVAAANNRSRGKDMLDMLLSEPGLTQLVTPEVVEAILNNTGCGPAMLATLRSKTGEVPKISTDMVINMVLNMTRWRFFVRPELLRRMIEVAGPGIQITTEVIDGIMSKTRVVSRCREFMPLIIEKLPAEAQVTTSILSTIARFSDSTCCETMGLLLERPAISDMVTPDVVTAALHNHVCGPRMLRILLIQSPLTKDILTNWLNDSLAFWTFRWHDWYRMHDMSDTDLDDSRVLEQLVNDKIMVPRHPCDIMIIAMICGYKIPVCNHVPDFHEFDMSQMVIPSSTTRLQELKSVAQSHRNRFNHTIGSQPAIYFHWSLNAAYSRTVGRDDDCRFFSYLNSQLERELNLATFMEHFLVTRRPHLYPTIIEATLSNGRCGPIVLDAILRFTSMHITYSMVDGAMQRNDMADFHVLNLLLEHNIDVQFSTTIVQRLVWNPMNDHRYWFYGSTVHQTIRELQYWWGKRLSKLLFDRYNAEKIIVDYYVPFYLAENKKLWMCKPGTSQIVPL